MDSKEPNWGAMSLGRRPLSESGRRRIVKANKARKLPSNHPRKVATAARRTESKRLHASGKRCAKPAWVDADSITAIYVEAARVSRETGIPREVDHIIPLQGVDICGLHVPWNLRVITRHKNRAKCNRIPPD